MKKNLIFLLIFLSLFFEPYISLAGKTKNNDNSTTSSKPNVAKKRTLKPDTQDVPTAEKPKPEKPLQSELKKAKTDALKSSNGSGKRTSTQTSLQNFFCRKQSVSTADSASHLKHDQQSVEPDVRDELEKSTKEHAKLPHGTGPKENLHIYLLNPSVTTFHKALKDRNKSTAFKGRVSEKRLFTDGQETGLVVRVMKERRTPYWTHTLDNLFQEQEDGIDQPSSIDRTQSHEDAVFETTSSVVFIEVAQRKFAITFGYGRHLLKKSVRDPLFALHAVLNDLNYQNPNIIKAFGLTIPRVNIQSINHHYSIGTSYKTIPGDTRYILNKVEGTRQKEKFKLSATNDSLCVEFPLDVAALPQLCSYLLNLSNQDSYKSHFSWVDDLLPVTNNDLTHQLDTVLFRSLSGDQLLLDGTASQPIVPDQCPLETDEVIQHYTLSAFPNATFDTLEELSGFLPKIKETTAKSFKKNVRVTAHGPSGQIGSWKLYNSLLFDTTFGDQLFILNWGKWYKVNPDFNKRVKDRINTFFVQNPPGNLLTEVLPEDYATSQTDQTESPDEEDESNHEDGEENTQAGKKKKKRDVEQKYNKRVARSSNGKLHLMDCRTVKAHSERVVHRLNDRIEVFDLISEARELIHVKNFTNSGTFSHLCAQGLVSSKSFKNASFRNSVRLKFLQEEVIRIIIDNNANYDKLRDDVIKYMDSEDLATGDKTLLDVLSTFIRANLTTQSEDEVTSIIESLKVRYMSFATMLTTKFMVSDFTVLLAFFHPKERGSLSDYLPFFSRLNLLETINNIVGEGYNVKVQRIPCPKKKKE